MLIVEIFFFNNRFLRERGIVWRPPSKWNTRFFFAFSKRTQPLAKLNWDSQLGRLFSLPSQRNFPISFKPKVAIAKFIRKMQKKSLVLCGLDAMPLFLLDDLLKFSFSEDATKIWKNLPLALMLLNKNSCFAKTSGRFFFCLLRMSLL